MKPMLLGQPAAQFGPMSAATSVPRRFPSRLGSLLMLAALTILTLPVDAGTLTGRVLNKATGQYLRNAVVEVAGTGRTAVTGDGGVYTIRNVPAGTVTLTVTYTGLDTSEQTVVVPEQGVVTQDVSLSSGLYDEDTVVLGEFIVAAQREGNAAAIVQQRQAINVQTTIAADAFGDVSEGNIGEFLKFLPGINVDYVDADVRAVRLRGLSPKYANVTIDGHPVASSASSSINTGRQFEFEQVSLATVDIVEINKSPTADQIASGMSGNVNVRSKSAFDQEGRRIRYSISANLNETDMSLGESIGWDDTKHHKALLNGSIEFSDTFFDNRLGVVAAFNHSGAYVEQKVLIGSYTFDRNPDNNETEVPLLNSWNFQDGPKPTWRDAAVLNLDLKVNDRLSLRWNNSYNWYKAPFFNRNWVITADAGSLAFNPDGTRIDSSTPRLTNVTNDTARSTAAAANNTASNAAVQGSNLRKSGGTLISTPSLHWETDRVEFDLAGSYSRSYNDYNSGNLGHFSQVQGRMPGVSWEYTLENKTDLTIQQINTGTSNNADMLNLANYTNNVIANNETRHSVDQFWTVNADVTLHYDEWQKPTTFKFGADHRLNVRDIQNFNPSWRINTTAALGPTINMGDYQEAYRPEIEKGETVIGINGISSLPPSPDKWRLYDLFTSYNMDPFAATASTPLNSNTIPNGGISQPFYNTRNNAAGNLRNYLQNQFDIKETVNSAYGMATIQMAPKVHMILGARLESTKTEGRSFDDIGDANALAIAPQDAGYTAATWRDTPNYILARFGTRRDREKSYSNVLPSAQIRYEPRDNLVLRGAYYRSILRPDYSNVVGGVTVNDAAEAFTVRNFELEPELADNFDARVEYYFEPVGVISFGVFYKDITDMQINVTDVLDPNNLPDAIADLGITPGAGELTISERRNVGSASLWGAEFDYSQQLSFLPDPWKGLGVFFNATYIRPSDDQIFALTAEDGIARRTVNTGFSFRKGRFDGRISANIVGERYRGITGINVATDGTITPGTGNNSNRAEHLAPKTQIDLNLSYELTREATIFCNISNLFNEAQARYHHSAQHYTRYGTYGARFTLGVKGSF